MFELPVLIISATANFLLGLFVVLKNTKNTTNKTFFALTCALVAWSVISYFSVHPVLISQLTWARGVLFFASLLNLAVFLAFSVFPSAHFHGGKGIRRAAVALTAIVAPLTLTPLVFQGLAQNQTGVEPVPGPGIALFALQTLLLLGGGIFLLARRYARGRGIERRQIKFVLLGLSASFALIFATNFVLVNIFKNTSLIPFGPTYTLIFSGAVAYAIIRHRLLDIKAVVARSVTFVLLLAFLAAIYAAALYGASSVLLPLGGSAVLQGTINTLLAIILALTYYPLRRLFEKVTDRLFFRDRYDSQELINSITKVLASELLLDKVLKDTLEMLCHNLRVGFGQFMIFDDGRIYKVAHFGHLPNRIFTPGTLEPLHHGIQVEDDLGPGQKKELMNQHGVRVSVPLKTRDEFVGYLFLGDKLSGDIYSQQDLDLLEILSKELAIAITNAKAYEEISQFNITLQDKVNEATARLRLANKNLKALDKTKDEFLSMASHQLRTPLTTIRGYISMILEGDAGKVAEGQRQFLEYALSGSERMVSLISDLLNVSRLSAGRFIIDKQPTDLVKVVEDEVRQLQSHADQKHLELVFDRPKGEVPLIELDEGKTRQVLMNFIDNAIYYTKEGGVYVNLSADVPGNKVTVKVRDTGIGVPPSAQKKLFTKFFRAGNAQEVRPDGTGLGLFLAKRVVEDQGGKIIFESTPGKGSVFGFEMPIKQIKPSTK